MTNPAAFAVARAQRRLLLRTEARLRESGDWGPWERVDAPLGRGRGWLHEVACAYRNRVFAVLMRPVDGGVTHLAISSLSEVRPTWYEAQRIKDELTHPDRTAVEVYPPRAEIVDGANMYHLWVLRGPLPFSLHNAGVAP